MKRPDRTVELFHRRLERWAQRAPESTAGEAASAVGRKIGGAPRPVAAGLEGSPERRRWALAAVATALLLAGATLFFALTPVGREPAARSEESSARTLPAAPAERSTAVLALTSGSRLYIDLGTAERSPASSEGSLP